MSVWGLRESGKAIQSALETSARYNSGQFRDNDPDFDESEYFLSQERGEAAVEEVAKTIGKNRTDFVDEVKVGRYEPTFKVINGKRTILLPNDNPSISDQALFHQAAHEFSHAEQFDYAWRKIYGGNPDLDAVYQLCSRRLVHPAYPEPLPRAVVYSMDEIAAETLAMQRTRLRFGANNIYGAIEVQHEQYIASYADKILRNIAPKDINSIFPPEAIQRYNDMISR